MKFTVVIDVDVNIHPESEPHIKDINSEVIHDLKRFFEIPIQREINNITINNMNVKNICKHGTDNSIN